MKKLIISLLCVVCISCSYDKRTADLVLESMQCLMCSVNVEKSLLELKGVKKVTVDLKNKSGQVIYNASVIDLNSIENKISSIGYSVNDKLANQEAYEKLEIRCKNPNEN